MIAPGGRPGVTGFPTTSPEVSRALSSYLLAEIAITAQRLLCEPKQLPFELRLPVILEPIHLRLTYITPGLIKPFRRLWFPCQLRKHFLGIDLTRLNGHGDMVKFVANERGFRMQPLWPKDSSRCLLDHDGPEPWAWIALLRHVSDGKAGLPQETEQRGHCPRPQ